MLDRPVFICGCALGLAVGAIARILFQSKLQPTKTSSLKHYNDVMHDLNDAFFLTVEQLQDITRDISEGMVAGLAQDGLGLGMLPTYLDRLPNGSEKGEFIAVDFRADAVRIVKLFLHKGGRVTRKAKSYAIPNMVKTGTNEKLLRLIAQCVADFCPETTDSDNEMIPLGFTFPLPIKQQGIRSGILLDMVPGYDLPDLIGQDVIELLQDIFYELDVKVRICALVNDTTATLLSEALKDEECKVGLVVDSGSNICYMEQMQNIKKWAGPSMSGNSMAINVEWSTFSGYKHKLPMTEYDILLNELTPRPVGTFQKMVASRHLGELVRLVCVKLQEEGELFVDNDSHLLTEPNAFNASHMAVIEGDNSADLWKIKDMLACQFNLARKSSFTDRLLLKRVCELVSTRAAALTACGVVAVIEKIGLDQPITVCTDGVLCRSYPGFMDHLMETMDVLSPRGHNVKFVNTEDPAIGVAVAAALANSIAYT